MPALAILIVGLAAAGPLPIAAGEADVASPRWSVVLHETFASERLDPERWEATAAHDVRSGGADVQAGGGRDGRLRLHADTIGTDDSTVKFVGVVHRRPLDLTVPHEIALTIDWSDQRNGSYLTAGVYLAPARTTATPETESDWLKFEYVGVPPGRNGRGLLALKSKGRVRILDDDGWPAARPEGRALGRQRVRIVIDRGVVRAYENDAILHDSVEPVVPFAAAHLYLQMSSHSNYPSREVFFDDVLVRAAGIPKTRRAD